METKDTEKKLFEESEKISFLGDFYKASFFCENCFSKFSSLIPKGIQLRENITERTVYYLQYDEESSWPENVTCPNCEAGSPIFRVKEIEANDQNQ